jgi:hypothetical protein
MSDKHKTATNPNGSTQQCHQRKVHKGHEWQAEFGAYFNVWCKGIQEPGVEKLRKWLVKEISKSQSKVIDSDLDTKVAAKEAIRIKTLREVLNQL